MEFKNKSGLVFKDISTEESRTYRFPGGDFVILEKPMKLHVSKSGGHRVFTADGNSHYIQSGWIHIEWTAKDGEAHFVC